MLPWIQKLSKFKKTATVLFFAVVAVFIFLHSGPVTQVFAQDTDTFGVRTVDEEIILSGTDIRIVIVKIIRAVLGLLGIITVSLIIYAGFLIMTSGGNEERIAKGKKTMINAVVGLVIIFSAFAIVQFIFNALTGDGNFSRPGQDNPPAMATFSGSGALGKIVKDHYPFRDATDIPRNTSIVVTFGIPIEPSSIAENTNSTCWGADNLPTNVDCEKDGEGKIVDPYFGDCFDLNGDGLTSWLVECDHINTSSIKIDFFENVDTSNLNTDADTSGIDTAVVMSYEGSGNSAQQEVFTLVFKPISYLGSSTENKMYTVHLRSRIEEKGAGTSVFEDQFELPHYYWNFETGTSVDVDPPHVESIFPQEGHIVSKNTIIQINFDEPMDPTVTQGYLSNGGVFENILVNTDNSMVTGTWKITNGYRSVEFISDEPCGLNSCGDTMYCLPVDCTGESSDECTKDYNLLIRTAEWTQNIDAFFESQPFSGVYDLAFNGLDSVYDNAVNGANETLNRPAGSYTGKIINTGENNPDNYWSSFRVKNEIDLSRPYVESVLPGVDTEDIDGDEKVEIGFNRIMWLSTLRSSISLAEYPAHVCADAAVGDIAPEDVTCVDSERLASLWFASFAYSENDKTISKIKHRTFGPNGLDLYYFPSVPSTVKATNQNCLYPGYGPWQETPALKGHASTCKVNFDKNGGVESSPGCVEVNTTSSTDTGCSYTGDATAPDSNKIRKSDVDECIDTLEGNLVSPTKYQ